MVPQQAGALWGKQNATDDDDDDDMSGKGNGDDDNDDDDDDDWCNNQKWVFLPPTGGSGFSYETHKGLIGHCHMFNSASMFPYNYASPASQDTQS